MVEVKLFGGEGGVQVETRREFILMPKSPATNKSLAERLSRINAAAARTCVTNLEHFPACVINTPRTRGVHQDFRGNASPDELMNDAASLIANVASLRDHLKKWARSNIRGPEEMNETVRSSFDLRVIIDLWERDKHGGHRRDRGSSRRSPRIDNVDRALRLRTLPKKGSWVTVQAGMDCRLRCFGDGSATVDTSGTVYDENGNVIGDLQDIVSEAIRAWERHLVTYEIGRGLLSN